MLHGGRKGDKGGREKKDGRGTAFFRPGRVAKFPRDRGVASVY